MQVPATVKVKPEGITFLAEAARIGPEQFFGIQHFSSFEDLAVRLHFAPSDIIAVAQQSAWKVQQTDILVTAAFLRHLFFPCWSWQRCAWLGYFFYWWLRLLVRSLGRLRGDDFCVVVVVLVQLIF
jgi:hypothetical protein